MYLKNTLSKLDEAVHLLQEAQEIMSTLGYHEIGNEIIETVLKVDDAAADLEELLETD